MGAAAPPTIRHYKKQPFIKKFETYFDLTVCNVFKKGQSFSHGHAHGSIPAHPISQSLMTESRYVVNTAAVQ